SWSRRFARPESSSRGRAGARAPASRRPPTGRGRSPLPGDQSFDRGVTPRVTPVIDGPRGCRPDELPQGIALADAAMGPGSDPTLRTDYPLVYAPENLPNISLVAVEGR